MNKIGCIILAAGQGTRFGTQKQFIQFKGKELWRHIFDKMCQVVPAEDIVVVGVDVRGGNTRSCSVINGLEELKKRKDYERVIILEAARPLVTLDQLHAIVEDDHLSTTFVTPLVNTIIRKDGSYLNRSEYYNMSTPTGFDFKLLYDAYMSGKFNDMTDDTRVMYEYYGIKANFLSGADNLLKLTYPSDLYILEELSKKYEC